MFLIISSINDHVISDSCDTWHIKEDAVEVSSGKHPEQ